MSQKNNVPSLPFPAVNGAVEAEVSVAHLSPYIPGARPAPYLNIHFVNEQGATLSFPMTARTAAVLLRYVNSLLRHTLQEFRSLGVGDEKHPVMNRFQSAGHQQHELLGFRAVKCTFATGDQRRTLRELAGLDPKIAITGEFPLIIVDVCATGVESKHIEASLVMDIWAAAALRDSLYAALSSALPDKNPNDQRVQTVDGVVSTIGI